VLRTNQVQAGKITGVRNNNVMVAIPGGEQGIPLAVIARVEMAEPAAATAGRNALRAGDAAKAIASLKPVVDQFKGLPTPWAEEITGLLGEAYIAAKDLTKAEAAFNDLRKFYPNARGTGRADVSMAAIDVARKNYAAARKRLDPIADAALKARDINAQDGAAYGLAFLLLGQIHEAEGRLPDALESYLRTVTIFHHDAAAAEDAHKRADALRKAHSVTVP